MPTLKHWIEKFRNALHGLRLGVVGQSSFVVHVPAAIVVLLLAAVLGCSPGQFTVLGLCIALVLSLELMNSAIEYLARGLCSERNPDVGKALDIASASVLVASIIVTIIGSAIFLRQVLALLTRE